MNTAIHDTLLRKLAPAFAVVALLGTAACTHQANASPDNSAKSDPNIVEVQAIAGRRVIYFTDGTRQIDNRSNPLTSLMQYCLGGDLYTQTLGSSDGVSVDVAMGDPACADGQLTPADTAPQGTPTPSPKAS